MAIPLLIVAEGVGQSVTQRILPQFQRASIVADTAAFNAVLQGMARLRDRTLPWHRQRSGPASPPFGSTQCKTTRGAGSVIS